MSRPRRVTARFTPNPFYEGAGTWVLEDGETGRRQHVAIWPPMSRAEFLRLARHHIRALAQPLPSWTPPAIRFGRARDDDDTFWS